MPASLQSVIDIGPELTDARSAYERFVGLPQGEIIVEGILVETTSATLDGQEYAVRNYLSPEIAHIDFENRLPALVHGLGRQGLEQLVAYSPEDGVLVTRRSLGRPVRVIGLDEAATMTQERFDDLALAIDFATRANIEVDVGPDNLLFDPIEGFGLIDYSLTTEQVSTGRTVKEVGWAMLSLGRKMPTFGGVESIRMREKLIRMVTQSGCLLLSQSDSRALIEANGEWIDRCWSGDIFVDAE